MTHLWKKWVFLKFEDAYGSWLDMNQTNQIWQCQLVVYGVGDGKRALRWETQPLESTPNLSRESCHILGKSLAPLWVSVSLSVSGNGCT